MLAAAAVVPIPPLLVPAIAGGSADEDDALRRACQTAVGRLLDADPDSVVVVGPGTTTGPVDGSWDWRGFGVPLPDPAPTTRLPLGLAIGSWLLDTHPGQTPTPTRRYHAVSPSLAAQDCAAVGRELVSGARRIGLLVCGDGSARRNEGAPGHLDPTAEPWDMQALAALRAADPAGLLALDAELAVRVMAAGRAPWQVLAGAAGDDAFDGHIDWADAPYGVMYIAGSWTRRPASFA